MVRSARQKYELLCTRRHCRQQSDLIIQGGKAHSQRGPLWPCYLNYVSSEILYITKPFWGGFLKMNPYLYLHLFSDSIEIQSLNLHMQITKEFFFIPVTDLIVLLRFSLSERNLNLSIKESPVSNFQSRVNSVTYIYELSHESLVSFPLRNGIAVGN